MANIDNLRERSLEVMTQLFSGGVQGEEMPARKLVPEFFEMASSFCFGGFWSRPELDIRSRSLCTVAQLAALGRTDELKIHLQGAVNLGVSQAELLEVLEPNSPEVTRK